jgi:hypothetical protein
MKYLWVDSGNDADLTKGDQHDIDGYYFDLFDPRVTEASIGAVASKGHSVGVYMAWNWPQFSGKAPATVAKIVSDKVRMIVGPNTSPNFPRVQFDLEQHNPEFIAQTLEAWRKLQPTRATSWTMESFQGGWMYPAFVQRILACRVRVVPQYYKGDMSPVAEDVGLKDMLVAGFPFTSVTGFYDAAALPANWSGFAFTQGRLPS